jgi:drug/metabolite transporter (DMT)-like permease
MTLQIGIFMALACAFATNLGFLYKYRGARAAASVDIRHPVRSARSLFGSKWFAIGMLVATGAWGFHVLALALAPMSVVQVVLSGGIVLLAVMAERLFGLEVGLRQWGGVAFTALGLILLAVTLPKTGGSHSQFSLAGMIAFEGGLVGAGCLLIMGPRLGGPAEHHGMMLGAAAGILFGVSDIAIKAITGVIGDVGVVAGFLSPWTLTAVVASVAAFYASARGLQDGEAVPVIAVTGTAANVCGIAGGIIVFGDPMPGDPIGIVVQVAAFLMVCAAAALTPAPVRAVGHARA